MGHRQYVTFARSKTTTNSFVPLWLFAVCSPLGEPTTTSLLFPSGLLSPSVLPKGQRQRSCLVYAPKGQSDANRREATFTPSVLPSGLRFVPLRGKTKQTAKEMVVVPLWGNYLLPKGRQAVALPPLRGGTSPLGATEGNSVPVVYPLWFCFGPSFTPRGATQNKGATCTLPLWFAVCNCAPSGTTTLLLFPFGDNGGQSDAFALWANRRGNVA